MSFALFAAACASEPLSTPTPRAAAHNHGTYKVGQPYQIDGTWYYPKEDPTYDETGVASWYGPNFYEKATANGEIYHAGDLTAAHRTLPMPVNVRVTNLDNGKSLVVRVNDRGPFAKGRIIDLSEHAAELLGYKTTGTARVRVQFVSRADLDGGRPPPDETPPEVASAVPAAPTTRRSPPTPSLTAVPGADRCAAPVVARPLPMPAATLPSRRRRRRDPAHRHRHRGSPGRDPALCPGGCLHHLPECRTPSVAASWRRPADIVHQPQWPDAVPRPFRPL